MTGSFRKLKLNSTRITCRTAKLRVLALEDRTTPSVSIPAGGFETPALTPGTFQYAPAGTPWTYSGGAGVASNNSPFTAANGPAPQGTQVAFVQGNAFFRQPATFTAGTYVLTFNAAQRANIPSIQTLQVLVDGQIVGSFDNLSGPAYVSLVTSTFTVTEGNHTITFQGTNLFGGDNTLLIDLIAGVQQAGSLNDNGFEIPALNPGNFKYNPTGTPWTFTGTAGVSANSSSFTNGNPPAPQGAQVAFLQQQGSVSQAVQLPFGTFTISFSAAQRGGQASRQTWQLRVDGNVVGTYDSVVGTAYSQQLSSSFSAAAGLHTIAFVGTNRNGGDATVLIDQVFIQLNVARFNDTGFELPALNPGTFQYNPTNTPWTFAGNAGVAANNSGFTAGNPAAPQGSQVAFLQRTGSFSQTGGFAAGTYAISFFAARRGNLTGSQGIQVLVDGVVVGTFTNPGGPAYAQQFTTTFALTTSNHTITFRGTNGSGDNTAFIDLIEIVQQAGGLSDAGFEGVTLPAGTFRYQPTGTPWTYSALAGIAANNSGFTAGNPGAPLGNQVGFLQRQSTISQTASFLAGTYAIGFLAAQRGNLASQQTFRVLVDGVTVGNFNNVVGTAYAPQMTSSFTLAAGNHTVTFQGTNLVGGDNTIFLDSVTVSQLSAGLNDTGFERGSFTPGTFQYNPASMPWTFTGTAGISTNFSPFTSGNFPAPQGSQVALIQKTGRMSQVANFAAGTYNLSFFAAQRGNLPSVQTFEVLVNNTVVGTYNNVTGNGYTPLGTVGFTLPAGNATITFRGTNLNGGDNTIFIDAITVNPV